MSTPPVDSSISTITWALHIFIAQEGGQEQWDEGRQASTCAFELLTYKFI